MKPRLNKSNPTSAKNLKAWLKRHWVAVAIITGAIIVSGGLVAALYLVPSSNIPALSNYKPKPAEKFYSPLTGVQVDNEDATKQAVTAVMIENSPDARPQSGLKQAGVVYEALAEGGVTRFLAVYQQSKPQLIGPVRSLRIYYLDWAAPYNASIAHVGGSGNALSEVRNGSYRDIDQFFNPDAYWRSADRYAPHNMYTGFERLDALNSAKGYTESNFTSFKRSDGKTAQEPNATSVAINFSGPTYNTSYAYDAETNTYHRSLAGAPHNDREEGLLTPSVVVALKVDTSSRGGADGYEDIVTSGSGQAYVFQNGTVSEVTWQKDDRSSPLKLLDAEGNAITLNRGQTWVAAVTSRGNVSWQ